MKDIGLKNTFYISLGVIILTMALSYVMPFLMTVAWISFIVLILWIILDVFRLYPARKHIEVHRSIPQRYALGNLQNVHYHIRNDHNRIVSLELIDELPYQLQIRDHMISALLEPNQEHNQTTTIRPLIRGVYHFGSIHCFVHSERMGLIRWRKTFDLPQEVAVVPSFILMKKYDLEVFGSAPMIRGLRKVRRLGQNDEFEHIKHYDSGDDIKMINWKASARRNEFMVNQYQDTQSQPIYAIIDKGRSMKMPFEGLTLLDHSINSALVLSNIVLKKYDRMGLLTIGRKVDSWIKEHNRRSQLMRISDALYAQETDYGETDIEHLYFFVRRHISRRGFFFLYTNYEHRYDMHRALPYLIKLNQSHVLIVIMFTNRELMDLGQRQAKEYDDIYRNTLAMSKVSEKERIADELGTYGIKVIMTLPEELNINVINKYLELKAKRVR